MPDLETMTVKLKKSKVGATGNINVADFDPELHEKIEEKAAEPPKAEEAPKAGASRK